MANSSTISQRLGAVYGTPTAFVLTVTNGSGGNLTVDNIAVYATDRMGRPAVSVTIPPVQLPIGATTLFADAASLYVPFSASFFGPAVIGNPTQATETYILTAVTTFSNDTLVASVPFIVSVADPVFGSNTSAGAPPNPAANISAMQFFNPANSANLAVIL